MTACVVGLTSDLFLAGSSDWFELDKYDLRAWLAMHGGDPSSPFVAGLYDAVFAANSQLGAGAILQSSMKSLFCFNGGPIYKMYAGMGDTIFTPLYLALKQKGVKFVFFRRVEKLGLSEDGQFVDTIEMERQIVFDDVYDPFVRVKASIGSLETLECWPDEPRWDRLPPSEVERVRGKINLENYWTPVAPVERMQTLSRGADFDAVLLGISVAALPDLCVDLMVQDGAFERHVRTLAPATTATQSIQLWFQTDPSQTDPIVAPFVEPYDTVATMNQLLPAETWEDSPVAAIRYLCSPIPEPGPPPPRSATDYPAALNAYATQKGIDWLTKWGPKLWPNLVADGGFDWSSLWDPSGANGEGRMAAQYVNTPLNKSDRYVIPTPNSYSYRLLSNGTRFLNFYITGDWIKTALSVGCLEAAAMGGIQAARAIALEAGAAEVPRAIGDWIEDVTPRQAPQARMPRRQRASVTTPQPQDVTYRTRDGEFLSPPPYETNVSDLWLFVLQADPT
jgi:uncharacterized protein with NAD-binding domain and iron-sulfur cluster